MQIIPSPDDLRAITKVGNIKNVSDTSEETEGSELVKERILAEDDRPLYIRSWRWRKYSCKGIDVH
ncbi:MAG: nucleoside hydrolase-like domain-containing protein [Ruminococcus sp.]